MLVFNLVHLSNCDIMTTVSVIRKFQFTPAQLSRANFRLTAVFTDIIVEEEPTSVTARSERKIETDKNSPVPPIPCANSKLQNRQSSEVTVLFFRSIDSNPFDRRVGSVKNAKTTTTTTLQGLHRKPWARQSRNRSEQRVVWRNRTRPDV